jgi:hypothetical protein
MSYAFDVFGAAWARLRNELPEGTRDGEVATRFELMLEELHDANHRLGDAVARDERVTRLAGKLQRAMSEEKS